MKMKSHWQLPLTLAAALFVQNAPADPSPPVGSGVPPHFCVQRMNHPTNAPLSAEPLGRAQNLATDKAVAANNAFAFDLYSRLAKQPGNLCVSPCSAEIALVMVHAGAGGQTARQMAEALHLPGEAPHAYSEFANLLNGLNDISVSGNQLVLANSIWVQQEYPILKPFERTVRSQFGAGMYLVDFASAAGEAGREMNSWVAKQTRGKILEITSPDLPDADTRLVLANAMYFKGRWMMPFDKALTTNSPFRLDTGGWTAVPMMKSKDYFAYAETDDLQVLGVPYISNILSFVVLLPKKNGGLSEVERTLTAKLADRLFEEMEANSALDVHEVYVSLPKFNFGSKRGQSRLL